MDIHFFTLEKNGLIFGGDKQGLFFDFFSIFAKKKVALKKWTWGRQTRAIFFTFLQKRKRKKKEKKKEKKKKRKRKNDKPDILFVMDRRRKKKEKKEKRRRKQTMNFC